MSRWPEEDLLCLLMYKQVQAHTSPMTSRMKTADPPTTGPYGTGLTGLRGLGLIT